jgi:hypothetical protein
VVRNAGWGSSAAQELVERRTKPQTNTGE